MIFSPLKLYESMASGTPTIVSDLESLSRIVLTAQCGMVVPAGEPAALAEAVAAIAADPARARAMGRNGRLQAVANYSWPARAADTAAVIERVTQRREQRTLRASSEPAVPRLVGQSQWAYDMARGFSTVADLQATVVPMDYMRDAPRLLRLGAFRTADNLVRVGFRPGASTLRGSAFDFLLSLITAGTHAKHSFFWIGSDVQETSEQAALGGDMRRFRESTRQATHVADSFELRNELRLLGLEATVAWMPPRYPNRSSQLPRLPPRFTVLSYVPINDTTITADLSC